ncbi:hypothetical protein GGF31_006039 [Allomyces arbusculus]|nr:hypothetical protein GGF31_006039 [Allomyces arbusculus]
MAQINEYALDVSIKVDNITVTATVDGDMTTLYDGAAADLTAEQKEPLVSLFTIYDHDEADEAGTLPREATFHAKFFAPEGVTLDVPGLVKAVLEYCKDDVEDDDMDAEKDVLATRDTPDMADAPPRGGQHGRGGFRGTWGGRGGMMGMMGRGGMGPSGMQGPGGMRGPGGMGRGGMGPAGGMGPGGMGPGGMGPGGMPGFPHGFPGHQGPLGEHGLHQGPFGEHVPHNGPHGGPHGMPFGPGAPFGGAYRMPGQWQYQGKSKHGAISLAMDIREI